MANARIWLETEFPGAEFSDVYSTHALNGKSADYLNMVVRIKTLLSVEKLSAMCKEFEAKCGRTRESKIRGSIEMDIDIMQFGSTKFRNDEWHNPYFTIGFAQLANR